MSVFKVSVITGVFNAGKYIRKAVESAVQLTVVDEIILVEDGSDDNSLEVCKELESEFDKIKLFQHPDKKNHGAGASRNLGIKKSSCEFIAFLDADDYYLPNRFDAEKKLFETNPDIDGVYGALGFHYFTDELKDKYEQQFFGEMTTTFEQIQPEKLKYALTGMCRADKGYFSLVALSIKKSLIDRTGYFNEKLLLHQDTDFIIKLSLVGNMAGGIIDKPIGMRGVHGTNRITNKKRKFATRYLMYKELNTWVRNNIVGEEQLKRFISKDLMVYQLLVSQKSKLTKSFQLIGLFNKEPFAFYIEYSFNMLMYEIYGGKIGKKFIMLRNKLLNTVFEKKAKKWDTIIYDHYCD